MELSAVGDNINAFSHSPYLPDSRVKWVLFDYKLNATRCSLINLIDLAKASTQKEKIFYDSTIFIHTFHYQCHWLSTVFHIVDVCRHLAYRVSLLSTWEKSKPGENSILFVSIISKLTHEILLEKLTDRSNRVRCSVPMKTFLTSTGSLENAVTLLIQHFQR